MWGEPEQVHMQNMETLQAHGLHQKTQFQATGHNEYTHTHNAQHRNCQSVYHCKNRRVVFNSIWLP